MKHELKTWPKFFAALRSGSKTFEVRRADRNFRVGDTLILREWDPSRSEFTEAAPLMRTVTYVMHGPAFGVEDGFCVMAVQP